MGKKRPVRLHKHEKPALTLNEVVRAFRKYLPHIVGAVCAISVLVLALAWFKQASVRQDAAAWSKVFSVTPEELAVVVNDFPSSSAAPWALARQIQLLYEQARYQELIAAVDRLETEYPSHPSLATAYLFLARSFWDTGELEKAVQAFDSSYLTDSHYAAEASWYSALCSEMLGNLDRAQETYRRLSAEHPGRYWAELASIRLDRLGTDLKPLRVATGSAVQAEPATETK